MIRRISFNNSAGQKIGFNENGELETGFDIINWITFENLSFKKVHVGGIDLKDSNEKMVTIYEDDIVWPSRFNQVWTSHIVFSPDFTTSKAHLEPNYSIAMNLGNRIIFSP